MMLGGWTAVDGGGQADKAGGKEMELLFVGCEPSNSCLNGVQMVYQKVSKMSYRTPNQKCMIKDTVRDGSVCVLDASARLVAHT